MIPENPEKTKNTVVEDPRVAKKDNSSSETWRLVKIRRRIKIIKFKQY